MHASVLLLVLSSLGAQAVPLFHARSNDTLARRDEPPYSVVNVGDETTTSQTPTVETVTVANPPQPPVTLTVTQTPSSTATPSASPISSGHFVPPAWKIPSMPTEGSESDEDSHIAARGFNQTERSLRNLRRSVVANSTMTRDLHVRSENTTSSESPELHARSNATLARDLHARGDSNSTLTRDLHARSENATIPQLHRRSNGTEIDLRTRSANVTERGAGLFSRGALNATTLVGRSNGTVA